LIEKFIKNGKLLRFIADNQGQPQQNQESASIKTKSQGIEIAPLRSTGKFVETEGGRNPVGKSLDRIEVESTAEAHGVLTHVMNRLSPIFGGFGEGGETSADRKALLGTRSFKRL